MWEGVELRVRVRVRVRVRGRVGGEREGVWVGAGGREEECGVGEGESAEL